jgi:hypothetical protein
MRNRISRWASSVFTASIAASLALTGCMKSGEDVAGARPGAASVLDASHGGARIVLPAFDPSALAKLGADSGSPDTAAKAWFELGITGENMASLFYRFPLTLKGAQTFEIKGIPAGKQRSFRGSLRNAGGVVTHEGVTLADIQAGVYADVRLFLAKASGGASVCVVIEGQKLPPCALDSLPPPPDSAAIGGCWQLLSDWVGGKVKLYDSPRDGSMGILVRDTGAVLDFSNWTRRGDTLTAILYAPNLTEKWLFNGVIRANGAEWSGMITNSVSGKTTSFSAKTLPCALVVEPGKVPSDTLPPKPDTSAAGSIPMPGSGAKRTTLCFEMRFDYGTGSCEVQGYAKMDFLDGKIPFGNMSVAEMPGLSYTNIMGQYDSSAIRFYGVTKEPGTVQQDTLDLKGYIGGNGTMAKGDYLRLPSGKKGNWTMKVVQCGAWYPVYPDSSCFAKAK